MSAIKPPVFRPFTGYLRRKLSHNALQPLNYSGEIDDELWNLLDYYSEVTDVGIKHVLNTGVGKKKSVPVYKLFSAHLRQAKNYYYSAKNLPNKSSSLLYYYSFLNLAKALVIVKNPQLAGNDLYHGLRYIQTKNNFVDETIKTHKEQKNIFPYLYQISTNRNLSLKYLNITRLLAYCTDINYQYSNGGYGLTKIIPIYYALLVNDRDKTGWGVLAIDTNAFNLITNYPKSYNGLLHNFEKISVDQRFAKDIFDFNALTLSHYTFIQSRVTTPWVTGDLPPEHLITNNIKKYLDCFYQTNYFDEKIDFFITLPYSETNQSPINEMIAIYTIMFYLSSLVRYRPDYIEKLYYKKDMWIIDSFVKFCPITFLRNIVPLITGIDYVLTRR